MTFVSALLRHGDWWSFKIAPILAIAYAVLSMGELKFSDSAGPLLLILISIFSLFSYGYIINDIFDIEEDLGIGKTNVQAGLTRLQRLALCLFFIALGFAPLFIGDFGWIAASILFLNYVEPTIYSAPPIRLKERGWAGVIADAMGVHLLPTLFIISSITHLFSLTHNALYLFTLFVGIWAFFFGLRGIIIHQAVTRESDKKVGVRTFGNSRCKESLRLMVLRYIFPLEILGLVFFSIIILTYSRVFILFILIFFLIEVVKIFCRWKLPIFYPESPMKEPYIPLLNNHFYEVWMPFAFLSHLVLQDRNYLFLLIIHLVLFRSYVKEQFVIHSNILTSIRGKFAG